LSQSLRDIPIQEVPMIKLYWSPRSRSFTTLWLMEETGQPYERILTDIATGAQKSPDFLKVNPMGKVPALQDGDVTMAESAAICAYVADRYPQAKLAPPIGDPRRAKYLQWLFFAPSCIEPAILQAYLKLDIPTTSAAWGSTTQTFDVLDQALAKGPWLLGDEFSAADVAIGAGINYAIRMFNMVPTRPNFDRYLDACTARPAFQRAAQLAAG
jgi:glutathione S-transferase